jgi:hypothetical protein
MCVVEFLAAAPGRWDRGSMRSIGRVCVAVCAAGVLALATAPSALAEPIATCTSTVVDGVETDHCVGNPNATNNYDQPRVDVRLDLGVGIGF